MTIWPGSVTVVQQDEIKRYGHRTLADILRTVPGLHVSYDRVYGFLGTRGFEPGDSRALVQGLYFRVVVFNASLTDNLRMKVALEMGKE